MFFRVSLTSFTFIALVLGEPSDFNPSASSNVRSMRSFSIKPSGGIETPMDGSVRSAKRTSSKSKQQSLSAALDAAVRSETLVEKPKKTFDTKADEDHDGEEATEENLRGDTDEPPSETQENAEAEQAQLEEEITDKEDKDDKDKVDIVTKKHAWCKVWGDPHIFTFDSYLGSGKWNNETKDVEGWYELEHRPFGWAVTTHYWNANERGGHWWLVRRADDSVAIQGLYGPCTFGHMTCLQGIAISGKFMDNKHNITQTIAVKSICDWDYKTNACTNATGHETAPRIYLNGNRLSFGLSKSPGSPLDPLRHMEFKTNSTASATLSKPTSHENGAVWRLAVKLPGEIRLHMRFFSSWVGKGAMSAHIKMEQSDSEQCGHCGNFDDQKANDDKYETTGLLKREYINETGKLCDAEVHCGDRSVPVAEDECQEYDRNQTVNSTRNCRPAANVIEKWKNVTERKKLNTKEVLAMNICHNYTKRHEEVMHPDNTMAELAMESCVDDACEGFPPEALEADWMEAVDVCKVTLYQHWPEGMTHEKASSYYEAWNGSDWETRLATWDGSYPQGDRKTVHVAADAEKTISLAKFKTTSSVKVEGKCCTVRSFASTDCQGDAIGSMDQTTKVEGEHFTGEAGLVTPRENLESNFLKCNDDKCGCIHVKSDCDA